MECALALFCYIFRVCNALCHYCVIFSACGTRSGVIVLYFPCMERALVLLSYIFPSVEHVLELLLYIFSALGTRSGVIVLYFSHVERALALLCYIFRAWNALWRYCVIFPRMERALVFCVKFILCSNILTLWFSRVYFKNVLVPAGWVLYCSSCCFLWFVVSINDTVQLD